MAKLQAYVLYASHRDLSNGGVKVAHLGEGADPVFVRAELVDEDYTQALEHATPRPGEIVLNSIPAKDVS